MSESKHSHEHHGELVHDTVHPAIRPYWKRAHRDWRFWVGVFFMLAAMSMFVMRGGLPWLPHSQPRQPPMPVAVGQ